MTGRSKSSRAGESDGLAVPLLWVFGGSPGGASLFLEALVEELESDWSWREADRIEFLRCAEAL